MLPVCGFDHIHVLVPDRQAVQAWYEQVLGLRPVERLASWTTEGGPLMVPDPSGQVMLALFEGKPRADRSTIALRVASVAFLEWKEHLQRMLPRAPRLSDHLLSWSLYFEDPFGNPYDITTYAYEETAQALRS